MKAKFLNRREAGIKLAEILQDYHSHAQGIVLGLPRGGVPVAYEIATSLNLPLDVCLVKKLSLPDSPEVAIGAIVEDSLIDNCNHKLTLISRDNYQKNPNLSPIPTITAKARTELKWRDRCYRQYRPLLSIQNKVVIVVDDGLATGWTMQAAIEALSKCQPQKIIIAVPVASSQAIARLSSLADEMICLLIPNSLGAVGFWYEDFTQVSDGEVCDLLSEKNTGLVAGRK